MTGLIFPEDLTAWRRWAKRQRGVTGLLRAVKDRIRPVPQPPTRLWLGGSTPTVLFVVDKLSPSCRIALMEPFKHFRRDQVAVISALDVPQAHSLDSHPIASLSELPSSLTAAITLGGYNRLASWVEPWFKSTNRRFIVVQHGLFTPWAPPLNDGDHLLAWSEEDAAFWSAQRPSITTEVVGSQMLWEAAAQPAELDSDIPVMLGQLHGIELPTVSKLNAYRTFCVENQALYRPHPNEADVVSRLGHQVLKRAGVKFETSGRALPQLGHPVVSIFSTGTLEAAQRGLPAWVYHPDPKPWVRDFWRRYRLHEYGADPTPAHELGPVEPAKAVASAALA